MAPAQFQDHYLVLGLPPTASLEEIKKAFRRLALKHHPDKNKNAKHATVVFQQISVAWEILSDAAERPKYDTRYREYHRTHSQKTSNSPTTSQGPHSRPTGAQYWQSGQGDERTNEEHARRKSEWQSWVRTHNLRIEEVHRKINKLEKELEQLEKLDKEHEERLSRANSWWSTLNPWTLTLSEGEKQDMERERMQRIAAKRIKEAKLSPLNGQLKALQKEKVEKERQERQRQEEEDLAEQRKRQAAEREKRRREAEELSRVMREQQRAREEAERARQKRAAELRDEMMKEQEKWRKEEERARQERERREKERQEAERKVSEILAEHIRATARAARTGPANLQGTRRTRMRNNVSGNHHGEPSYSSCRHKVFWNKIDGRQVCPQCNQMQYVFLYKCPSCSTMGCAACMKALKEERK